MTEKKVKSNRKYERHGHPSNRGRVDSILSMLTMLVGLVPHGTSGGGTGGAAPPPIGTVTNLLRFTINPLTRTVTVQLLH